MGWFTLPGGPTPEQNKMTPRPVCWLCKKPIKGLPHYQGGSRDHPCHKKCRIVIKMSRDGGI